MSEPLELGTVVKPWGRIGAIRTEGGELGERYYFMMNRHGTVSMMPAFIVERAHAKSEPRAKSGMETE